MATASPGQVEVQRVIGAVQTFNETDVMMIGNWTDESGATHLAKIDYICPRGAMSSSKPSIRVTTSELGIIRFPLLLHSADSTSCRSDALAVTNAVLSRPVIVIESMPSSMKASELNRAMARAALTTEPMKEAFIKLFYK
ncbi:MAG: hypothetical protein EOP05_01120 [Proteobacteria bacterium]|nr:MAG: hypothetical protein EOP05_01120 [Pseudomonadota bacterium]